MPPPPETRRRFKTPGDVGRTQRPLIVHEDPHAMRHVHDELWEVTPLQPRGTPFLRRSFELCSLLGLLCCAGLVWTRWAGVAGLFATFGLFAVLNGVAYLRYEEPLIGARGAPLVALASFALAIAMVVAGITS